jgi:alpha-L-arabinofuranosidase
VTTSTGGRGNELHLELAEFARVRGKRIMFDCHSFKGAAAVEGIAAFARWLKEKAPEASVGILEFNAGAFDFQRGLNHALEMNATHRHGDVIRAVGTPNVSQPWGVYQTDWKAVLWTQGNIYYTPSKVWFQPAYYVDQMIAKSWAQDAVAVEAPATLDIFAAKTTDGSKLVLRVVNNTDHAQPVRLDWQGVTRSSVSARVTTLAHTDPLDSNTESQPEKIKPVVSEATSTKHVFPAYSFTVMEIPIKP